MPLVVSTLNKDIANVSRIAFLPQLLDLVCMATGMGFAAVARVTDEQWIAAAVKDEINFGLKPGGELPLESTICNEIRQSRLPVVIDYVAHDTLYRNHHTPKLYRFQSYVSFPIFLKDGTFFGTLCAIDPNPALVSTQAMKRLFSILSDLIGEALESVDKLSPENKRKLEMYASSEMRNLYSDLGSEGDAFRAGLAEGKMQMLSFKMELLLMALDARGSFLNGK
jgi:hypothetical protein